MHKLIKNSCQVFGFIATVVLFKYLQYTFLGVNGGECTWVGLGTAAVGAGVSMYNSNKSASALKKSSKPVNLTKATRNMLGAYKKTLPDVTAFEKEYRPQFQGLNLGDISAFLQGTGGQAGLYQQTEGATTEMQRQFGAARANELAQQTGQAGQVRGLFQSLSPEAAARVQQAQDQASQAQNLSSTYKGESQGYVDQARNIAAQAQGLPSLYQAKSQGYVDQASTIGNEAFARRGYLSPEQMRNAEQQARAGAQAAGRVGGNLGIASEIMNRENALAARRSEATTAGQNAFNQFGTQQNALSNLRGEAQNAGLNAFNQFQLQQNTMGNLRGEAQNANLGAYQMGNQFYAQPGLEALNRTPAGYLAGQQQLNIGLGQIGQGSPKLFDYGQAFNQGAVNQQNATAAAGANAQMSASNNASMMSLLGNAASAYGSYAQNQPAPQTGTKSATSPWGNVNYSYT